MASITVTISDHTAGPFSLAKLFSGTAPTGTSVLPGTPLAPSHRPSYTSIQADPGNTTKMVYVGDSNILGDGTVQGVKLAAGVSNVVQQLTPGWPLSGRYVNGDNGAVINIEVLGGS